MHLRVRRFAQRGHTYEYAELVQSFRGRDGKPTAEVLAKLGKLDPTSIANLKVALEANRQGKPLVLPGRAPAANVVPVGVCQNLAYLDVMAVVEMWKGWELGDLLQRLLRRRDDEMSAEHVALALTVHRIIEPGSKLSAVEWFAETCLPEFLRVEPGQFNNSRVHRILSALENAIEALQKDLPLRYFQKKGKPEALFLDVTDTYFEGRGPEMAERSRTKEGLRNRRKVGITLLCDERGTPLQWSVVPGKRDDQRCMSEILDAVEDCMWIGNAPVVCDRAMGRASGVDRLLRSGLRFLTAVTRPEMGKYGVQIPSRSFVDVEPESKFDPSEDDLTDEEEKIARAAFEVDVARVTELARASGMEQVDETLFVMDLGRGTRPMTESEIPWVGPDDINPKDHVGAASMLAWARIFKRVLASGEVKHQAEIAELTNMSRARVTELMNMLQLDGQLQEELLAGKFGAIPERCVREVVKHRSAEAQRKQLVAGMKEQELESTVHQMRPKKLRVTHDEPVRCVAYFNPQMFVGQRLRERRHHRLVTEFVEELNKRLASPRSRLDEARARSEVIERLARDHELRLYEIKVVTIAEGKREHLRVSVERREEERKQRREYDGFVLLVGHQDLPHSAAGLARLYREKDQVEKDFRVIKSNLELRPVYHRTDLKVRAHVALCMLALLLERALETRLAAAGLDRTADASLRTLSTCHLNVFDQHALLDSSYSVTRPTPQQRELLKALGLSDLARDREVAKRILPRVGARVAGEPADAPDAKATGEATAPGTKGADAPPATRAKGTRAKGAGAAGAGEPAASS